MRVHDPTAELEGNEMNEDEDVLLTQEAIPTTCPWSRAYFVKPIQCKKCKHCYEENEAFQRLRGSSYFDCPVMGCPATGITKLDLFENPTMSFKIKKEIARLEEEKKRKEHAAVDLSDDDEEL